MSNKSSKEGVTERHTENIPIISHNLSSELS